MKAWSAMPGRRPTDWIVFSPAEGAAKGDLKPVLLCHLAGPCQPTAFVLGVSGTNGMPKWKVFDLPD